MYLVLCYFHLEFTVKSQNTVSEDLLFPVCYFIYSYCHPVLKHTGSGSEINIRHTEKNTYVSFSKISILFRFSAVVVFVPDYRQSLVGCLRRYACLPR